MEYKFSNFKRPYLKDFIRDFFNNLDDTNNKEVEFQLVCETVFEYKNVCKLNIYDLPYGSKFFEDNSHLKVMSVIVTPDKKYTIKCC